MADKYTLTGITQSILANRLITELDTDADIAAVPTTVKKVEVKDDDDELVIEFNDDIIDASAAETAMNSIVAAHDGTPLTDSGLTPSVLTEDTNDYSPQYWAEAKWVNIDATGAGATDITGFKAGYNNERKTLRNVGTQDISIKPENVLSASANRVLTFDNADHSFKPNSVITIQYMSNDTRWLIIETNS